MTEYSSLIRNATTGLPANQGSDCPYSKWISKPRVSHKVTRYLRTQLITHSLARKKHIQLRRAGHDPRALSAGKRSAGRRLSWPSATRVSQSATRGSRPALRMPGQQVPGRQIRLFLRERQGPQRARTPSRQGDGSVRSSRSTRPGRSATRLGGNGCRPRRPSARRAGGRCSNSRWRTPGGWSD